VITIRPMRWWDIPSVHAIEASCFPNDSWSVDQFWRELAGATRDYVVADSDGTVVGYAGISSIASDSDLQTLAVDPMHRGGGLGRQLLVAMLDRAHNRGATSMILEVRADNATALKLYATAGFETIATRTRYYPDGSDALIMRRRPLSSVTDGALA
jgi:ribosomal-protein-alanine N-acetyltransferase